MKKIGFLKNIFHLQAAASQGSTTLTPVLTSTNSPQHQGLTVTPTSGNFNNYQLPINGTTLFKQSFGQATNGNATFPPTATLLQNQSNVIQQNGNFISYLLSLDNSDSWTQVFFEIVFEFCTWILLKVDKNSNANSIRIWLHGFVYKNLIIDIL